jgi:hypothetical protein
MAFPESINNTVHTSWCVFVARHEPDEQPVDGIFSDSLASELVTPAGSPSSGYTANLSGRYSG